MTHHAMSPTSTHWLVDRFLSEAEAHWSATVRDVVPAASSRFGNVTPDPGVIVTVPVPIRHISI